MSDAQRLPFKPLLPEDTNAAPLLHDFALQLAVLPLFVSDRERNAVIEARRRQAVKEKNKCDAAGRQPFLVAMHVLADLAKQGWSVSLTGDDIEIAREANGSMESHEARERIRSQLHAERDEQLRQPATAAFIKSMETRQPFKGQFVSIFSLMRDGRELSRHLREVRTAAQDERVIAVGGVIRPYLQFITREDHRCPHTGFRLMDVWRYFRHTWASPYKSVPGRSMLVLVRDEAAPFHPVIGIAALSSAAVARTARDEKIGWTAPTVIEELRKHPTARLAKWLQDTVDESINEIYKVDFLQNKIITLQELKRPNAETVKALEEEGRQQRKEHHRFMDSGEYKKSESANKLTDEHWEAQARSPLFRSKRALELAYLLSVRMILRRFFKDAPSKNALLELMNDGRGRDAVAKIVRKSKADRVGTAIADLTVCGAIPPYNEILGGKLVAMLMVSPETVAEYRRRYAGLPSVIASSMAGRPLSRAADLVYIGTTSLYGQRPSQYDRISIPKDLDIEASPAIRFSYLGRTKGIGTIQFGSQTVAALAVLLAQSKRGQQVNSVFGEGVNPRLRKLRDGLNALGLPTDDLLNHGGPRLVYGAELTYNTHAYLLGMEKQPKYILPLRKPSETTIRISHWWMIRWLLPRIDRDEILQRVARHSLIHPIRHGARVDFSYRDFEDFS